MNTLLTILAIIYKLPFTVVFVITNLVRIIIGVTKRRGLTQSQQLDMLYFQLKQIGMELQNKRVEFLSYLFSTVIWVCIFNL
jgi:hypothetical protein